MQHSLNFDVPAQPHPVLLRGDKWDSVWSTLADNEDLNFVDASRGTSLASLITSSVEAIHTALLDGWTMMVGYSSGKDSETVLHLFLMALIRAVRTGQTISQHHFILHTDTLIESPEVRWLADKKLAALERFIAKENLPLTIVLAKPGITQSWTGRILTGRGLPTFSNSSARQCSAVI
jgi:DNA sulfur modification protein DndC